MRNTTKKWTKHFIAVDPATDDDYSVAIDSEGNLYKFGKNGERILISRPDRNAIIKNIIE